MMAHEMKEVGAVKKKENGRFLKTKEGKQECLI